MSKLSVSRRVRNKQSPAHARSPVQEAAAAKRIGGRVTPGSGAGYQKLDARSDDWRVEAKVTANKSFRLTTTMIEKLEEGSFGSGAVPVFEVELELGKHRVYVVPAQYMDRLFKESADAAEVT